MVQWFLMMNAPTLTCYSVHVVPSCVEDITVNPDQKTITWAEPNGIIVGYRVQYWELGRRGTAEEVNTIAEVFSYINLSKYSAASCTSVNQNSTMTTSIYTHITYRCRCSSQGASSSCHCSRSWGEKRGWGSAVFRGARYSATLPIHIR